MIRLLPILLLLAVGLSACGGGGSTIPTGPGGDASDSTAAGDGANGAGGTSTTGIGADGGIDVTRMEPGQGDGPLSRLVISTSTAAKYAPTSTTC